ncbi:hypothetical protein L484_006970 [Morus notabilis]|uniref:Uncharacterized protein n=1 Tax=Morus notabilis TaxID=981085 RepID=W9RI71_9ROSA|nr:hypothetical protein L484_006970 [Morus notabilis]
MGISSNSYEDKLVLQRLRFMSNLSRSPKVTNLFFKGCDPAVEPAHVATGPDI